MMPHPRISASVTRWLQEQPDPATGLGHLETLALEAVRCDRETPVEIFSAASVAETPPQFRGDTELADRGSGSMGPTARRPPWEGVADLKRFRIAPDPSSPCGERSSVSPIGSLESVEGYTILHEMPPSTTIWAPVMYLASSEARKSAACATSQASPILPVGHCRFRMVIISSTSPP